MFAVTVSVVIVSVVIVSAATGVVVPPWQHAL